MKAKNKVSDTVTFHINTDDQGNELPFVSAWKAEIDAYRNAKDFRGVFIIQLENCADGHELESLYGIDIALRILRKDPFAKIVLYSTVRLAGVRKLNIRTDLVMSYPYVRFLESPFADGVFKNVFKTKPQKVEALAHGIPEEVRGNVATLLHDFGHISNRTHPEGKELIKFNALMEKTREYFPALATATPAEVLEFLELVSSNRPEVAKGQYFAGVYCDVGGTLVVDGELNDEIVRELTGYREHDSDISITLWTDGDLVVVGQELARLGVRRYPLRSKSEFAGAVVEVVIDDDDRFTFTARTKIIAKKFYQSTTVSRRKPSWHEISVEARILNSIDIL